MVAFRACEPSVPGLLLVPPQDFFDKCCQNDHMRLYSKVLVAVIMLFGVCGGKETQSL